MSIWERAPVRRRLMRAIGVIAGSGTDVVRVKVGWLS